MIKGEFSPFSNIDDDASSGGRILQLEEKGVSAPIPTMGVQSYCDACNASCFLMNNGKQRRKVQARYEGFVLIKRAQRDNSTSRCFLPQEYLLQPPASSAVDGCCERRHSCGDVIDASESEGGGRLAVPAAPVRSLSHVGPSDFLWEKLVNLSPEEGPTLLLNNNLPAPIGHHISRKQQQSSSSDCHSRLSRKKSRSQDNLINRRIKLLSEPCNSPAVDEVNGILLNNNKLISPCPKLSSSLSRSEGSIHNVTCLNVTIPTETVAVGGLRAEVEELARLPKKLLDKVTDEFGHIVFYLERWREEYIILTSTSIAMKTNNGRLQTLLPYSQIEDVQPVAPCSITTNQHCLLVVTRKASILMQATTSYVRDQWLHTIIWKKNVYKYRNLLKTVKRPEVLLKELKNLVKLSLTTPLHDHSVCQVPLEVASSILTTSDGWLSRSTNEEIIVTLSPLLENNKPSPEICSFFSRHCSDNPRSRLVIDMFTPVVSRILKHNVDFGMYPYVRRFVHNYIQALNSQNDGQKVVHNFVHDIHGSASQCPHLRVLPNLVSVCTSAIGVLLEAQKNRENMNSLEVDDTKEHLECYFSVLLLICDYEDWRPGLALLLQPVPFPDHALAEESFIKNILPIIYRIGTDSRCQVHQMVLGSRENKDGWIHFLCPSSLACYDKGDAWTGMLKVLLSCCYKRKKFLRMLLKSLGSCMLLALRDNVTAQDVLCLMLEWQLVDGQDQCLQIITTLQSTSSGKKKYQGLCDRQLHLQELQQKFGPRKLTLPSLSTDGDVMQMLSSGPFGNLEVLSLAFTRATSACAELLIQLPTLRCLSLWATQFGDNGLLQICEHLHNLQVLNLCETPVTDKGLIAITALKNLRKLNLNSTKLSPETFELLKKSLPALQEVDVRYTDAW